MRDCSDIIRLFKGENTSEHHFQVLSKKGQFVIFLPEGKRMVDATLRLYPAQRVFARSMITLTREFMRLGIPMFCKKANFFIDEDASFSEFLKRLIPGSQIVPNFGFLDNRIEEFGRPCIMLLFDATDRAAVVVKVGTSKAARRLIQGEQAFFFPTRPDFPSLPEPLDWYEGEGASAIAYRYVEGAPPHPRQHGKIASVLKSWIHDHETIPVNSLLIWRKFEILLRENPGLEPILETLQNTEVKPVLTHGDFAPWNVRTSSSSTNAEWMVLDWECGAHLGLPGWDWLNFVVQYHTWVRRSPVKVILAEIEALFESPDFQDYAQRTGITPVLKELTFVYLLYSLHFNNPRFKTDRIRDLAQLFNWKYFPDIFPSIPPLRIHEILRPHFEKSVHWATHG